MGRTYEVDLCRLNDGMISVRLNGQEIALVAVTPAYAVGIGPNPGRVYGRVADQELFTLEKAAQKLVDTVAAEAEW